MREGGPGGRRAEADQLFRAPLVYSIPDASDDAECVARCLKGDTAAFEPLVARYQRALFTVALRLTANHEDARDATQNAFIRAFERLDTFDPSRRFFSWLYRIAVNESLNLRRTRKAHEPIAATLEADAAGRSGGTGRASKRVQAALMTAAVRPARSDRPAALCGAELRGDRRRAEHSREDREIAPVCGAPAAGTAPDLRGTHVAAQTRTRTRRDARRPDAIRPAGRPDAGHHARGHGVGRPFSAWRKWRRATARGSSPTFSPVTV